MPDKFDLIVIGAGHNGLSAAAYLAKAGLSALVLEQNEYIGGGVSTGEMVAPGFRHDRHSSMHTFIQANPLIANDELGLISKYGLKYIYPEKIFATIFDDQSSIVTYKDIDASCDSIAQFSQRDADAYRKFVEASSRTLPLIVNSLFVPPAPQGPFWALLDQSPEGQNLMSILQRSVYDVVKEWFSHERVILHLLKFVSEALCGPEEKGTGIMVFTMPGLLHTYGPGMPEGGSGALSEALVRCLEAEGAEIRTNTAVQRVLINGGKATGVELSNGETILANRAVIGTIHPFLLDQYVEGLEPRIISVAKRMDQSIFSQSVSHFALTETPRYHAEQAANAFIIGLAPNELETFRRAFDSFRYGDIPEHLLCSVLVNSFHDPSRAPAGNAALTIWTHLPFCLKNCEPEDWDKERDALHARVLDNYRRYVSNISDDKILNSTCHTPVDMVRSSPTFQQGDNVGTGAYFYQFGGHRPTPDLAQYAVPGAEGLYLTGAFMHPGGGVFGGGRATAVKVAGDLDIDFNSLLN